MKLTQKRWFKVALGPVGLFFCWIVAAESYRLSGNFVFLALALSYIYFLWTSKTKWMRFLFVAYLVVSFVPVDITLRNYPGPPRFVPLILGMPRDDDFAREERGDVVLRGCISRGNDPRWVLVW